MKIKARYLAAAYIAIAILTFGHVATNHECFDYSGKQQFCRPDDRAVAGYAGSIFWPYYWSWKIQEKL